MREIRLLRSRWRGLETESRLGLHGHERGNPGYRQDHDLTTTAPALDPTCGADRRADHTLSSLATRSACPVAPISLKRRWASRSSRSQPAGSPSTLMSWARSRCTSGSAPRSPVSRTRCSARESAPSTAVRAAVPSVC